MRQITKGLGAVGQEPVTTSRECMFRMLMTETNRSLQNASEVLALLEQRLMAFSQPVKDGNRVENRPPDVLPEIPSGLSELRDVNIRVGEIGDCIQSILNRLEL